ncbi:unnamed protein product [Urochloa humidicola]
MASSRHAGATLAAIAVVAIIAAAATTTGVAVSDGSGPRSYLTSWSGPGCTPGDKGRMASVGSCGCNHVRFHGGHEFNFRGEKATLYNKPGCAGTPYEVFEDTRVCGDFGWRSIHIDC